MPAATLFPKKSGGARVKAYVQNMTTRQIMPFQFNQPSIEDDVSMKFDNSGYLGKNTGMNVYKGRELRKSTITLYFKTSATSHLKNAEKFLEAFVPAKRGALKAPPALRLAYGKYVLDFNVVTMKRAYTEFDASLNPTEATFTLSVVEV